MNDLASLIENRRPLPAGRRFAVTDDWLQGRTCYGGLISTLAAQAMRDEAGGAWPADVTLRALQTSFVGPVAPGELDISVSVLRQGKNVCQVMAHARQADQVAAALLGVFSADRPSALQVRRPQPTALPRSAEELRDPGQRPAPAPPFLDQFDIRWAEGPPPFSGGAGWTSSQFLRLRDARAAALRPELQTVLLADMAPTPVMGQLSRYAPNSSVTWALELRPVRAAAPAAWWRADNESTMVEGGYVNHAAKLWSPGGALAAFGYQVVAVFA